MFSFSISKTGTFWIQRAKNFNPLIIITDGMEQSDKFHEKLINIQYAINYSTHNCINVPIIKEI